MQSLRTITTAIAVVLCSSILAQSLHEVRVFAHRGGRYEQDENTLQAFKNSYAKGYSGFETDVRMTKDGVLVISHDSKLDRTNTTSGVIEEMTAAELRKVVSKKGNPLLFLDDFLDFLKDKPNLYVEFEMKTTEHDLYPDERMKEYADKLYKAVQSIHPENASLWFTSFDYRTLRYMMQKYPQGNYMAISSKPLDDATIDMALALGVNTLACTIHGTSRDAVRKAHKKGLTISLWPGNCIEDTVLGFYLEADRLCTDVPEAVKTFLDTRAPWLQAKY